jgi:hypothetical protein
LSPECKKALLPGDLVKISVDGMHYEIGLVVEQEQDKNGFWHIFSRGRILLVPEWEIVRL